MQKIYGGSAVKNSAKLAIEASPYDGRDYSITLAPLKCFLKWCEFFKG
jgi:1,4-alpha-glucan branching enzyme